MRNKHARIERVWLPFHNSNSNGRVVRADGFRGSCSRNPATDNEIINGLHKKILYIRIVIASSLFLPSLLLLFRKKPKPQRRQADTASARNKSLKRRGKSKLLQQCNHRASYPNSPISPHKYKYITQNPPMSIGGFCTCLPHGVVAFPAEPATGTCAARRTIAQRARLVDDDFSSVELLPIEHLNCARCVFVICHLDKAESARAPRHTIHQHRSTFHCSRACKEISQAGISGAVGKTSYIKLFRH